MTTTASTSKEGKLHNSYSSLNHQKRKASEKVQSDRKAPDSIEVYNPVSPPYNLTSPPYGPTSPPYNLDHVQVCLLRKSSI